MAGLSVEGHRDGDRYVLTARGELAEPNFDELTSPAVEALSDRTIRSLIVDLAAITFIDSTGIGALLSLHGTAADVGARLVLRNPTEQITRLLHLIGVDHMLVTDATQSRDVPSVPRHPVASQKSKKARNSRP